MCASAAAGDEEGLDEGEVIVALQAARSGQLVGRDVAKDFHGHGTFQGKIIEWNALNEWYLVNVRHLCEE